MTRTAAAAALTAALAAACNQGQQPTTSASAARGPIGPSDLREVDRLVIPLVQRPVKTFWKDIFPESPYGVTLEPDHMGANCRVKVDLDRDRKPDEVWVVESGDRIKRMISTADDGVNYDVTLWLENGVWTTGPQES